MCEKTEIEVERETLVKIMKYADSKGLGMIPWTEVLETMLKDIERLNCNSIKEPVKDILVQKDY